MRARREVVVNIGQVASVKRTFSQADFDRFAAMSGDDNPIHVDPAFSAQTKFGRTVAHGMLLYSTVCGALSTQLPGPGTVQLEQELMFPSPTYVGEEVTIWLQVTRVEASKGLADLATDVVKPDGNRGLQGRTLVRLPDAARSAEPTRQPSDSPGHLATDVSLKGLEIGQRAETGRVFTAQDLAEYADLTGDVNPIVTDADYARRRGLAGPLIPGGLLGGLFSYLLGTTLPGRGTNYLKQRLEFLTPAHPGEELTASVEIVRIRPAKHLVNLSTVCTNPDQEVICRGEALVLVSDLEAS